MMRFTLAAFADEADSAIEGQIKALSDNGIRHLEIRGVDGVNISKITKEKAKSVRNMLDSHGISVWSIGSPYGKIKITDAFSSHLDSFKYGLELASLFSAENMRVFSFYVPKNEADMYADEVKQRLNAFSEAALGSGVSLCHENEKGIYGDTIDRCLDIHRSFPDIKAVFDPANFVQCGQDTKAAWELLSGYVKYLHIKDAVSDGTVVPAGKGIGNIPYLLQRYKGQVLTLEPHLSEFVGLGELEGEDKTKLNAFSYASKREAFDAAVDALTGIVSKIERRSENG